MTTNQGTKQPHMNNSKYIYYNYQKALGLYMEQKKTQHNKNSKPKCNKFTDM